MPNEPVYPRRNAGRQRERRVGGLRSTPKWKLFLRSLGFDLNRRPRFLAQKRGTEGGGENPISPPSSQEKSLDQLLSLAKKNLWNHVATLFSDCTQDNICLWKILLFMWQTVAPTVPVNKILRFKRSLASSRVSQRKERNLNSREESRHDPRKIAAIS